MLQKKIEDTTVDSTLFIETLIANVIPFFSGLMLD